MIKRATFRLVVMGFVVAFAANEVIGDSLTVTWVNQWGNESIAQLHNDSLSSSRLFRNISGSQLGASQPYLDASYYLQRRTGYNAAVLYPQWVGIGELNTDWLGSMPVGAIRVRVSSEATVIAAVLASGGQFWGADPLELLNGITASEQTGLLAEGWRALGDTILVPDFVQGGEHKFDLFAKEVPAGDVDIRTQAIIRSLPSIYFFQETGIVPSAVPLPSTFGSVLLLMGVLVLKRQRSGAGKFAPRKTNEN